MRCALRHWLRGIFCTSCRNCRSRDRCGRSDLRCGAGRWMWRWRSLRPYGRRLARAASCARTLSPGRRWWWMGARVGMTQVLGPAALPSSGARRQVAAERIAGRVSCSCVSMGVPSGARICMRKRWRAVSSWKRIIMLRTFRRTLFCRRRAGPAARSRAGRCLPSGGPSRGGGLSKGRRGPRA